MSRPCGRHLLALGCLAFVLLDPRATLAGPPSDGAGSSSEPPAPARVDHDDASGDEGGDEGGETTLPRERSAHASPLVISGSGGAQEDLLGAADPVRALFEMPPSTREDAYGPRPAGVPAITREQIVRYGLDNPYVKAADEHIEAMRGLLSMAKFAWVPIVRTSAVMTPGAAIECDDISLQGESGPFSFQYCRAAGDPADGQGRDGEEPADLQTVGGYFDRIAKAGVSLRLNAEFIVPITTFGKIVVTRRLAEAGVDIAEFERMATEHETILRIYEAHAALLLARESVAILQEAWSIVEGERTKIEADLGLGPDGQPAFDADPSALNLDRDPDDLIRLEVGELD